MDHPITPTDAAALLGDRQSLDAVRRLERALLQLPQVDLPTEHIMHGGLSARTITIPAGTVLTGALTRLDNVCVVCGDITVTTDDGVRRLTGVHVIPASAGAKRAGVAHADTTWVTLHRTDLQGAEAIEDEMSSESAQLLTRRAAVAHDGGAR